ncbi:hypothetical protein E3N88_04550 [Mikania micrantha]|uniref:FAR1 domain-containing protein n=1 Tax=Mikania micrantha TaxID=192012 RepID=A0A5N6PV97_9ASTR|nr:hypothetical protein E3N88_04550 [Mikania micrantha]
MGGGDQPLEESENFLSPVVREPEPDHLNDDIFDILTGDSPLRYIGFNQQGCHSSLVYQTPNGSRYWCPDVSSRFKPEVGKIFLSWDEVYKMYKTYGEMSGFGIHVGGYKKWKGEITHRFLVCNKAGKPRGKRVDSMNPTSMAGARATCFKVTCCKELIRLRTIKGFSNYVLYEFSENHNHELISSENIDLTRKGKHLNFEDVHFVHAMSLNRVGATVAHRLQTSLKGGHHNMRGTRNSFKNVYADLMHNSNIRSRLHKLVWNVYISPATFEEKWHNLMAEFELNNHIWLNEMFQFVTSGSTNTLVQFQMCFDTAIDNQWYNQRVVEFKSNTTTCLFKTGLDLEVHAAKIYTQTIFKDVQKEIYKGMINCFINNVDVVDNFKVYTISHMDNRCDFVNQFKVSVHMLEHSYECSCMGFTRVGHSQRLSVDNTEVAVLRNEVTDCVNACVDQLAFNVDGLSSFTEKIKELKKELDDKFPCSSSSHKKQCVIEHLAGQHDEETIDLLPPHGIRNKGCGTSRRLVGPGEKAIENSKKTPRMNRSCNQLTFHDSRNCKKKANVGESTSQK